MDGREARQNAPPAFFECQLTALRYGGRRAFEKGLTMNPENERIEVVPFALAEAQAQRYTKLVRWLLLGWAASVAVLSAVIAWTL